MFKFTRNKNGFGLVEVLMAAGLAGGIALTIAKLSQDANRVTKTTESNNEINMMMNDVAYILSDKANCKISVMNGAPSIPANGTVVSQIRRVDPPPAATSKLIYQTGTKYGNGTFTINSMNTEKDPVTSEVKLVLSVTRNNAVTTGAKVITKRIPLKVVLDGTGNNITSCFSDTDNMIAAAARAACHGNNARWDAAEGQCHHDILISPAGAACPTGQALKLITTGVGPDNGDSATFTCQPVMGTSSCPVGEYLTGFDAAGAPLCTALPCGDGQLIKKTGTNSFTCINVDYTDCGPGSVMVWNSPTAMSCRKSACDVANNEYLVAINSNGDPLCRKLPGGVCGTNQYIKTVRPDGTLECATIPAAANLPQQDYSFVDGYDAGAGTWSRKSIDQTAAQVCSRITGFIWNGTTCTPSTGGVTDFAGICAKIKGYSWNGSNCVPNNEFSQLVAFQLNYNGTTWTVSSTNVIFSNYDTDKSVNVVVESVTKTNGSQHKLRIHFNSYYMDSSEVLVAQYIAKDGNFNKLNINDLDGNNVIELNKADDSSGNNFVSGDSINIIWATPRM